MDLVFYVVTLLTAFGAGALWAVRPAPLSEARRPRREARTPAVAEVRS